MIVPFDKVVMTSIDKRSGRVMWLHVKMLPKDDYLTDIRTW